MPASMTTRSEHGEAIAKPATMPIWRRIYEGGDERGRYDETPTREAGAGSRRRHRKSHDSTRDLAECQVNPARSPLLTNEETQDSREGILQGSSNSVRGAHSKKKRYI
jgi:hypothetical protein